jgi:uroporphyrinogen-III synthase
MVSVLVTRPHAASLALATELKREGYEPVVEPLLEIVATPEPLPDVDVQAVMITSANALDVLASGGQIKHILGLPCFCVGSRTAIKAKEFGFQHIKHTTSDGKELAHLIGSSLPYKSTAVLHIAGRDVASAAQDELRHAGFHVAPWVVYTARTAADFTPETLKRLQGKKLDAVLVFSTRTADTLAILLTKHHLTGVCKKMAAIGLSDAVTGPLKPFSWRILAFAHVPAEDAMVECLKLNCPVKA